MNAFFLISNVCKIYHFSPKSCWLSLNVSLIFKSSSVLFVVDNFREIIKIYSLLFIIGGQPNIHPGLISSTGRGRVGTATSTQAAQLIGGGITPNMFTSPATVSPITWKQFLFFQIVLQLFFNFRNFFPSFLFARPRIFDFFDYFQKKRLFFTYFQKLRYFLTFLPNMYCKNNIFIIK